MRKSFWILISISFVCVILLTFTFPQSNKITYDYTIGRPWKYPTLIAKFNYTIKKAESTFQAEQDSVLKTFQPFYNYTNRTYENERRQFLEDYKAGAFGKIPYRYIQYILHKLEEIYSQGIMPTDQITSLMKDGINSIKIIRDNEASSVELTKIHSTRTAYDEIMNADSLHFERDILARCSVNNYLTNNLSVDTHKNKDELKELKNSIIRDKSTVMQGERIVDQGQMVTPDLKEKIDSYQIQLNEENVPTNVKWKKIGGHALFILLILILFSNYLVLFRRQVIVQYKQLLFLFLLITIFPLSAYLLIGHKYLNPYVIPFAMIPLFVRVFFDSRTATLAMIISILLTSLCLSAPYEFIILELTTGFTTVYTLKELTDRAQVLRVAAFVLFAGFSMQLCFDLINTQDTFTLDIRRYIHIFLSDIGLLFAYPLFYLIERFFGFTSAVTLVELSNINHPLLRRMSKEAQGTFNHSTQVANLAAEVANKIDANAQLVRTGALYHDIGKMLNPTFFTENQSGVNPHDTLEAKDGLSKEELSAKIIINHVTEGLRLAEKCHLPKVLRDFISTHHGKSLTKYFYVVWKNNHPNEKEPIENFTYPGPNPFTKEQAILMMCDAVEASSRSLKEYTEESITSLVNKIIDSQVEEGYLQDSPITFRDISDTKKILIDSLKTIYHTRISYPEINKVHHRTQKNSFFANSFRQQRKR